MYKLNYDVSPAATQGRTIKTAQEITCAITTIKNDENTKTKGAVK